MIIEKIDIRSFGLLTDMTLEFSEGVNVIEGQNEAGKSTIAAFIKYMLFGFDAVESDDALGERKKRINWTTGRAEGSMIVKVKGKKYLISRSTVPTESAGGRPSYKEESSIIDMESGSNAFGKIPAGEVFFGVSKDFFENTAFVGQIGDASVNEDAVKESIENILFSASERLNNQRAMSKLADKMDGLMHRAGHGGAIYDLTRKQEELEDKLVRCNEDTKQILAKESELYHIRHDRGDAEDKLEKLYDLDNCYRNVMLIQTFDKLHELEEECAAKCEAYNSFIEENTKAGYAPTDEYLTDLTAARRAVNDTYYALRDAEEEYSREKNAVGITNEIEGAIETSDELGGEEAVLSSAGKHHKGGLIGLIITAASALGLIAALVMEIAASGDMAVLIRVLGGVLGVASLGCGGFFIHELLSHKRALRDITSRFGVENYADLKGKIDVISQARAKRDAMLRAIENARVAVEEARENYSRAKNELTALILRWGEEPPTSELNGFLDGLEAKVMAFLERKRQLLEDKNTMELTVREIRHTLSDKNEIDIRAQVSPIKRKALSVINHDEIITGIAAYKAKISEQERLAYSVESELVALRATANDPAACYTKIKDLESRITELKNRHKAYFIAHKAIESASDNLRAGISPRLGEYATNLMGIMTDKKYTGFDVTGGMKVSYLDPDGVQRTVDFLSGGTRDLAYISLRCALVDMIYTECPPLIFDESFAHQDNIRARSMMKGLAYLCDEGYQSFIFTCRGREATLAKELVEKSGVLELA